MSSEKIYVCPICGKVFDSTVSKKPKLSLNHHIKFCTWRKELLDGENLRREDLQDLLNLYGSVQNVKRNLENKYPAGGSYWYDLFKDENIDTSIKNANNSEAVKTLRKQTNLERYGFEHNFCKDHPSRKEWEHRLLEEERITNVFQRESVKEKAKRTMIEKYGVEHAAQNTQFVVTEEYMIKKYGEEQGKLLWKQLCYDRGKSNRLSYYVEKYGEEEGQRIWQERIEKFHTVARNRRSTCISSLNVKFQNLLDSLNITYEQEFCLWHDEINPKFYDFKIDKYIFELNGDFWHANPDKYSSSDILHFPGGDITAQEIWDKDKLKRELAEKNGYKIIYYWEHQINDKETWNKIVQKLTNYANSKNKINKKDTNN